MDTHPCPNCGRETNTVLKCLKCGKIYCGDYSCGQNSCPNCGDSTTALLVWNPTEEKWG